MAPTDRDGHSPLVGVLKELNRCEDVCRRLDIWTESRPDTNEPLTSLLFTQVKSVTNELRYLKAEVVKLSLDASQTAALVTGDVVQPQLAQTLISIKSRLFETFELLDFYQREERHGQDGALNAVFASMHILNHHGPQDTGRAYYNEDKLYRIGIKLQNLVNEVFFLNRPIDQLRVECSFSEMLDQFRPHYAHTYQTLAETPYELDAKGSVFSGSYGTVQKVNHKRSGEALAMKSFQNVFSDKMTRKILREVAVLEVCVHRNIVKLVEAFRLEDDDQSIRLVMAPWAPYTLMNFLHNSDIKRKECCPWFEPNSPKSDRCIYRIMNELADAVQYLHGLSIKHKDLKPENILLNYEGSNRITPLITDVGVSKIYVQGGSTNYKDSTYEYLAPEQHAREESSLRSDIWQLGCCFAEIIVVAKGGTSACDKLHDSFINDDGNCLCSIATEHEPFMQALADICMPGNAGQKRAYGIITRMLDLDPSTRSSIDLVKAALTRLPT
ncbi:kinase-like domain-containing protein [Dactylonectria estremocensis]|uniref:Kinase-like domain-containing protein n=1 Tax=Dactylonectria estremocensis TaxID=1079267 RepID=A0A9P9E7Y7_9HYPO|nr:kinase-like domain-containing protein [Dactylonectria estremocensis]